MCRYGLQMITDVDFVLEERFSEHVILICIYL